MDLVVGFCIDLYNIKCYNEVIALSPDLLRHLVKNYSTFTLEIHMNKLHPLTRIGFFALAAIASGLLYWFLTGRHEERFVAPVTLTFVSIIIASLSMTIDGSIKAVLMSMFGFLGGACWIMIAGGSNDIFYGTIMILTAGAFLTITFIPYNKLEPGCSC